MAKSMSNIPAARKGGSSWVDKLTPAKRKQATKDLDTYIARCDQGEPPSVPAVLEYVLEVYGVSISQATWSRTVRQRREERSRGKA